MRLLRVLPPLFATSLVLLGLGCRPRVDAEDSSALEVPGRALTGQIVSVDVERGTLLVGHDEIPDYMSPMTMEFQASAADLANAEPGQRIRARLIEEGEDVFRLAHIWPVDDVAASQVGGSAAALREDTTIRGRSAFRSVGENLPSFALYDQTGKVVDISRYRGKYILLNFIYTRCPIATMCPAAVNLMEAVQHDVRKAGHGDQFELISITFDPEYDTPGVLREFAEIRGIDTSNYSFMTGPESAIKDLLKQFGVIAQVQGPMIKHTLATLLIDPQGRIIDRADGSQWDVEQFVRKILK
ncbi:MAG: SCO family protein [Opitutaceae bacterium]